MTNESGPTTAEVTPKWVEDDDAWRATVANGEFRVRPMADGEIESFSTDPESQIIFRELHAQKAGPAVVMVIRLQENASIRQALFPTPRGTYMGVAYRSVGKPFVDVFPGRFPDYAKDVFDYLTKEAGQDALSPLGIGGVCALCRQQFVHEEVTLRFEIDNRLNYCHPCCAFSEANGHTFRGMRGFTTFVNPKEPPRRFAQSVVEQRQFIQTFKKAFKAEMGSKRQQQLFNSALYLVAQHARAIGSKGPAVQVKAS